MSSGTPLTDADREPWLELIRKNAEHLCVEQEADPHFNGRRGVVIACSALKRYYRDILRGTYKPRAVPEHMDPAPPRVLPTFFVYLKGEKETLMERMTHREGHFMKAGMLESQLATLESPEGEDGCVVVRVEDPMERQVEVAREGLERAVVGKL
jgi:gluconokinase